MIKTQNSKQNSQQNKPTNTSASSAQSPTSSATPSGRPAGSTHTGSKRNNHQRWNNKKRFGTQKKIAAPVAVGPSKQYLSVCCSAAATKPRCGTKVTVQDPETRKTKDKPLGLGHWRCSACKKVCKVTVHAPVVDTKPAVTTYHVIGVDPIAAAISSVISNAATA
jgi:hypothetical protein